MNLSIIAIGDELLIGQVVDTNSGDIARMIEPHGWKVHDVQVIGDNGDEIKSAINRAFSTSDVVLTTGGLGPTKDDITKQTLCEIFGGEMRLDEATLENVKNVVNRRGIALNDLTATQAIVPTSCTVIQNQVGTAPLMWFERESKILVAMPGVPFETRQMFSSTVLPMLLDRFPSEETLLHSVLITAGLTESAIAMALDPIESAMPPELHLAYLPKPGTVRLRLDAQGKDSEMLHKLLNETTAKIIDTLGKEHILSLSDRTPGEMLLDRFHGSGMTLATAESCTGGNIAHVVTSVAGSSEYFLGSVVSYANEVKRNLLGVKAETLAEHGAVSEQVVTQMLEGVCRTTGADCAIATSGIAGPGGTVEGKPVGTVCMGVKTPRGTITATRHFPGSRDRVIDRATTESIIMLLQELNKYSFLPPH